MANMTHEKEKHGTVSSLSLYLQEIGKSPLLNAAEEKRLTRLIRKGNEHARQKMIESNLRLVVHVARKYASGEGAEHMLDLIQEGNLGLFRAIERFDPERGTRFSTYAVYWIRQSIQRYLERRPTKRLPEHIAAEVKRMRRARHRLYQELGRQPTSNELAADIGVDERHLMRLEEYSQVVVSLDQPVHGEEGENTELGDLIADLEAPQPELIAGQHILRAQIREVVSELPAREEKILRMRFGLDDGVPKTLEEIGQEFNVSRERVRQIQNDAFRRIRTLERDRLS